MSGGYIPGQSQLYQQNADIPPPAQPTGSFTNDNRWGEEPYSAPGLDQKPSHTQRKPGNSLGNNSEGGRTSELKSKQPRPAFEAQPQPVQKANSGRKLGVSSVKNEKPGGSRNPGNREKDQSKPIQTDAHMNRHPSKANEKLSSKSDDKPEEGKHAASAPAKASNVQLAGLTSSIPDRDMTTWRYGSTHENSYNNYDTDRGRLMDSDARKYGGRPYYDYGVQSKNRYHNAGYQPGYYGNMGNGGYYRNPYGGDLKNTKMGGAQYGNYDYFERNYGDPAPSDFDYYEDTGNICSQYFAVRPSICRCLIS